MPRAQPRDVVLWLALAGMWSSSYTLIKVGLATTDPAVLVLGRMLVGTAAIFAALKLAGGALSRRPKDWLAYTVTGLLGSALPFFLIAWGEQTVDSALASILMGTVPVTTLLLAAWLLPDDGLSPRTLLGVGGGFAGLVLLVGPAALGGLGAEALGQMAIIGATLCYATSTVYIRRWVTRPPLEMTAGSMLVGTLCIAGAAGLSGADFGGLIATPTAVATILYLGLLSTAAANLIYFHLIPRLGATRIAQVNFAVPVGGALLGVLVLGEAMTATRLAALALIVGSIWLGTSARRAPAKA